MKTILFFFPENPLGRDAGSKTRVLSLLDYFNKKGYTVDFIGLEGWVGNWDTTTISSLKESGLVRNVFILRFKPGKDPYWHYFFHYKIPSYFYNKKINKYPDNLVTYYMRESFDNILQAEKYDYVIINYIYWADLINDNPLAQRSKTIIDTHDFITPHHRTDLHYNPGIYVGEEIRRLNLFDEIWAISVDEHYLFSQLCQPLKVKLVPIIVETPKDTEEAPPRDFDVIYVASDNASNQESAEWFFKEVYKKLPTGIRMLIIGRITMYISDYPNVTKIPFAEDLSYYYNKSKVVICPMLNGTGVKVKVVEALSYGLPIVCTTRGIDGLPNKNNNGCLVTDDADDFAGAITSLLHNTGLYKRLSEEGKSLFNNSFSQKMLYETLDKTFK